MPQEWHSSKPYMVGNLQPYSVGAQINKPRLTRLKTFSSQDQILSQLKNIGLVPKKNLKKYADLKRREVQFASGNIVFLNLLPSKFRNLEKKRLMKRWALNSMAPQDLGEIWDCRIKLELPSIPKYILFSMSLN